MPIRPNVALLVYQLRPDGCDHRGISISGRSHVMEGAFEAMGSGDVDLEWARRAPQHRPTKLRQAGVKPALVTQPAE